MKRVNDLKEIKDGITCMKNLRGHSYTNYYLNDDKVISWICKGQMYICQGQNNLFMIRKRTGFLHVYFYSTDLNEFETEFKELIQKNHRMVVVDILDRANAALKVKNVLRRIGFQSLMVLRRMYKMNKPVSRQEEDGDVSFASEDDVPEINRILMETFDPNGEQLPDFDEIQNAVRARQIIITRKSEHGPIAAFLFFERNGKTTHLRFLASRAECREEGYGLIVYQQCFAVNADTLRYILWARDGNVKPNKLYQLSGFQLDGLVDEVFCIGDRGA